MASFFESSVTYCQPLMMTPQSVHLSSKFHCCSRSRLSAIDSKCEADDRPQGLRTQTTTLPMIQDVLKHSIRFNGFISWVFSDLLPTANDDTSIRPSVFLIPLLLEKPTFGNRLQIRSRRPTAGAADANHRFAPGRPEYSHPWQSS